jgi:Flp pilus assembly pilin Flp
MMRLFRRATMTGILRDEAGAAVVEFALVLPILMLIVFGIIDFGRAFYTSNNLVSAVREGARFAAVLEDPLRDSLLIKQRVRSVTQPFGGDTLTNGRIRIDFDPELGLVSVRVTDYPFTPITPIAGTIGLDTLPMTRQAVFRWERDF